MEVEVRYKDPRGKLHLARVTTGVEKLTPEHINRLVFRACRQLIYTSDCPYWGTELKAHSFRLRSLDTTADKVADYFWTIKRTPSKWTKWFNYEKFYDFSFQEETVTKTIIIKTIPRRH